MDSSNFGNLKTSQLVRSFLLPKNWIWKGPEVAFSAVLRKMRNVSFSNFRHLEDLFLDLEIFRKLIPSEKKGDYYGFKGWKFPFLLAVEHFENAPRYFHLLFNWSTRAKKRKKKKKRDQRNVTLICSHALHLLFPLLFHLFVTRLKISPLFSSTELFVQRTATDQFEKYLSFWKLFN